MLDETMRDNARVGAPLRSTLEQARSALDAAVASVDTDPEAACDDIVAARLLVNTALLSLDGVTTHS